MIIGWSLHSKFRCNFNLEMQRGRKRQGNETSLWAVDVEEGIDTLPSDFSRVIRNSGVVSAIETLNLGMNLR